jgi:hypothetical protein
MFLPEHPKNTLYKTFKKSSFLIAKQPIIFLKNKK